VKVIVSGWVLPLSDASMQLMGLQLAPAGGSRNRSRSPAPMGVRIAVTCVPADMERW
jgi:hypothetical protein